MPTCLLSSPSLVVESPPYPCLCPTIHITFLSICTCTCTCNLHLHPLIYSANIIRFLPGSFFQLLLSQQNQNALGPVADYHVLCAKQHWQRPCPSELLCFHRFGNLWPSRSLCSSRSGRICASAETNPTSLYAQDIC